MLNLAPVNQPLSTPPIETQKSLVLIDDDQRLADLTREYLSRSGYAVECALEGGAGLAAIQSGKPDLVILDLMLPDMDGLDVCRKIRALPGAAANVPVLMLTAKSDPMDRIVGLELGADDYLSKPFEPRELLARVRTILRRQRANAAASPPPPAPVMNFGSLEIDRGARLVKVNGKPADLTGYQFDLLVVLAERAGQMLSRNELIQAVRRREMGVFDRSIDVHVGRIRSLIESNVKTPRRILTVHGLGYIFVKHQG
jgi:DNA-binding response OmpR family regulator